MDAVTRKTKFTKCLAWLSVEKDLFFQNAWQEHNAETKAFTTFPHTISQ